MTFAVVVPCVVDFQMKALQCYGESSKKKFFYAVEDCGDAFARSSLNKA